MLKGFCNPVLGNKNHGKSFTYQQLREYKIKTIHTKDQMELSNFDDQYNYQAMWEGQCGRGKFQVRGHDGRDRERGKHRGVKDGNKRYSY